MDITDCEVGAVIDVVRDELRGLLATYLRGQQIPFEDIQGFARFTATRGIGLVVESALLPDISALQAVRIPCGRCQDDCIMLVNMDPSEPAVVSVPEQCILNSGQTE